VQVLSDRPGSITVETAAAGRQLVVLSERFHAGWRATQDGRERTTTPVYGDYLGCVVDSGGHRVVLTFAPDSARHGLQVTLAGLVLTGVATMLLLPSRVRRARNPREDANL
jgi:uncharacterized membrane protein YfhO